jgi:RNA polymerase sigma factor (sigma-70 family)
VHSAALRRTGGDERKAQDVTQQVFIDLARKAGSLVRHPALPAWLHQSTRFAAANLQREEQRRRARETSAALETETLFAPADSTADWAQLAPVLDAALDTLGETDRQTVLLRYFAQKPFADIAAALGTTEAAAQMRATRALEKLRRALAARGVTSTASALGLALGANAVSAAPASVAASTLAALSAATVDTAAAGTSVSAFFTTMTTSTKLTLGAGAAVLVSLGAASGVVANRHFSGPSSAAPSLPPVSVNFDSSRQTSSARDTAAWSAELAALRKELAAKDALLAEQTALLEKHASAQKEADKRRVFRNLEELGEYTAEVSLRFLDMQERYGKMRIKRGSPEEAAMQAEIAQITQDSSLLLEDPLFIDEMKSGDPARMTALQLAYLGEIFKFTPAQRDTFTRAVEAGYRAAYDQKVEWAMTDERLKQINQDTVRTLKAELNAEQSALWERARMNKLLFNFAVGAP